MRYLRPTPILVVGLFIFLFFGNRSVYTFPMPKKESPYSNFQPEDLILRDVLARDRTVLANERTLLAFFRTALMVSASGVTLIKFFPDNAALIAMGYLLIGVSLPVFFLGFYRYMSVRADMKRVLGRP